MELNAWFEKGMTYKQYLDYMTVNQNEVARVYEGLTFNEEDTQVFQQFADRNWKGIVLTADWCGDAALNVPVIQRMAEHSKIELRYLIRDENLELMDQYLTNGTARAIPIYVFINDQGEEMRVWGPRSTEVQQLVTSMRAELPSKDAPDFEEKQQNMYKTFKEKITTNPEIWRTVVNSVKEKLL